MESVHKSYAVALFELANEAKQLELYQEETKAISNILKDNKEFFFFTILFMYGKKMNDQFP